MIKKIVASSEILGAILSTGITDAEAFKANPKKYILHTTAVDLGTVDVSVVENTATTIHLALPYYESVRAALGILKDRDLSESIGGIMLSQNLAADEMLCVETSIMMLHVTDKASQTGAAK